MKIFIVLLLLPSMLLFSAGCSITGSSIGSSLECSGMTLVSPSDYAACYSDDTIYFTVENRGLSEVSGLMVSLVSEFNTTIAVRQSMMPGQARQQEVRIGKSMPSGILSVVARPVIGNFDEKVVCPSSVFIGLARCRE